MRNPVKPVSVFDRRKRKNFLIVGSYFGNERPRIKLMIAHTAQTPKRKTDVMVSAS